MYIRGGYHCWYRIVGIGRYLAVYIWRYIFGGILYIYRRFREKVTWGCKMNLYELHFLVALDESQDSEFLDAEECAQLSFIVFEIRRNEAS